MAIPVEILAQIRDNIKDAEAGLKEMEAEIAKARLAGIDVTEQQKEAESLRNQVRQLKAVYGKG